MDIYINVGVLYLHLYIYLSTYLPIYLPIYLPTYLPIRKEIYYKELAYATMEAKQSHVCCLQTKKSRRSGLKALRARELMV